MTNATQSSGPGPSPVPPPPLRPLPPLAKRLNRNALTVAAVIMGITVLTAVVVLSPGHEPTRRAQQSSGSVDQAPPVPARPTFLDVPVRPTTTGQAPPSATTTSAADSAHYGDSLTMHSLGAGGAQSRAA